MPKTIADPHPVIGVKPVTSQLVIASTGITVDLIDVDLTISNSDSMNSQGNVWTETQTLSLTARTVDVKGN